MTPIETKQLIRDAFVNVLENPDATDATYADYFSKDYIQHVDGKTLNYDGFVAHMQTLKSVVETMKVTFEQLIVDGDKVCSVHVVDAIKKDGNEVQIKVIAYMQIKDKKIVFCDELTHMLKGEKSDRDLGSRT